MAIIRSCWHKTKALQRERNGDRTCEEMIVLDDVREKKMKIGERMLERWRMYGRVEEWRRGGPQAPRSLASYVSPYTLQPILPANGNHCTFQRHLKDVQWHQTKVKLTWLSNIFTRPL